MEKILSMVDKINGYPSSLYIMNFILAIDCFLHISEPENSINLQDLAWEKISTGSILEIVFYYLVFNLIITCTFGLIRWAAINLLITSGPTNVAKQKDLEELRQEAIREESTFKYGCYTEAHRRRIEGQNGNRILFELIVLIILELIIGNISNSLVWNMVKTLPNIVNIILSGIFLLLGYICLKDIIAQDGSIPWVESKSLKHD